jgi:hypothetical protein
VPAPTGALLLPALRHESPLNSSRPRPKSCAPYEWCSPTTSAVSAVGLVALAQGVVLAVALGWWAAGTTRSPSDDGIDARPPDFARPDY